MNCTSALKALSNESQICLSTNLHSSYVACQTHSLLSKRELQTVDLTAGAWSRDVDLEVCRLQFEPANLYLYLRPPPHVSVFVWKRNFLFADTPSVHTYCLFVADLMAAMLGDKKTKLSVKCSPERNVLKTPFSFPRVDGENRNLSKTMTYQYWIQPTRGKENGEKWWLYVLLCMKGQGNILWCQKPAQSYCTNFFFLR